jgi:hypothetical protein
VRSCLQCTLRHPATTRAHKLPHRRCRRWSAHVRHLQGLTSGRATGMYAGLCAGRIRQNQTKTDKNLFFRRHSLGTTRHATRQTSSTAATFDSSTARIGPHYDDVDATGTGTAGETPVGPHCAGNAVSTSCIPKFGAVSDWSGGSLSSSGVSPKFGTPEWRDQSSGDAGQTPATTMFIDGASFHYLTHCGTSPPPPKPGSSGLAAHRYHEPCRGVPQRSFRSVARMAAHN